MGLFRKDADAKRSHTGYFAPRTWEFWRAVITAFCICSILGHLMEFPYCYFMSFFTGVVEENYALFSDPWFHPYWVYGFGALGLTFTITPLKEAIVRRCKTTWGAVLETLFLSIFLSMLMELVLGLIINQPDATGAYPYWDNSRFALNVANQAWLVNDLFIGSVGTLYVWIIFPLICEFYKRFTPKNANRAFAVVAAAFVLTCAASYAILIFTVW